MRIIVKIAIFCSFVNILFSGGTCPQDHLLVGCNPDGNVNTIEDNNDLYFDKSIKYRNTPDNFQNWYYALGDSFFGDYRLLEPGFDIITEPNRVLQGVKNIDYKIMLECVDISDGLKVLQGTNIILDSPGDVFCYSCGDTHIHLTYQSSDGESMQWITYRLYDDFGKYQPSDFSTVVFCQLPQSGDLVIDGVVDFDDLAEFCYYWLADEANKANDYYERADTNRDGIVNFADFSRLTGNWF